MNADSELKKALRHLKPALDLSMDAVCLVGRQCHIVYLNPAMRSFLKVTGRDLSKGVKFCDRLKLSACDDFCRIQGTIDFGEPLRLDESPAERNGEKLRLTLKALAIMDPEANCIGALVTVRDTTAEIVVQAKYHRTLQIIEEKEGEISELRDQLASLRKSIRTVASTRVAR